MAGGRGLPDVWGVARASRKYSCLSHHQQRLIPVYDRCAEKNRQQGGHAQKCSKRQLVVGSLPPRQNHSYAQNASQQRACQDSEQRAFRSKKCAGHQHHLHVAEAHAFASAQTKIGFRHEPKEAASKSCAENRISEREYWRGRREVENVVCDPKRRAIRWLNEKAECESERQARVVHDVRKKAFAQVGENQK